MDALGHALLGVVAVATLAQAVAVVVALVVLRRALARAELRVDALAEELRPQLLVLRSTVESLARLSEGATRQMPDVQAAIGDATERVRRTGEALERVAARPAGLLAAALAFTVAKRYFARRAGRA